MNSIDRGYAIQPIEIKPIEMESGSQSFFNSALKDAGNLLNGLNLTKEILGKAVAEGSSLGCAAFTACSGVADIATGGVIQGGFKLCIASVATYQSLNRLRSVNSGAVRYINCAQKSTESLSALNQNTQKTVQEVDGHLNKADEHLARAKKGLQHLEENVVADLIHIQEIGTDIKSQFIESEGFLKVSKLNFNNAQSALQESSVIAEKIYNTVNNIEALAKERVSAFFSFEEAILEIVTELITDVTSLLSALDKSNKEFKEGYVYLNIASNKVNTSIKHADTLVELSKATEEKTRAEFKSEELRGNLDKSQQELASANKKIAILKQNALDMEGIIQDVFDYQEQAKKAMKDMFSPEGGAIGLFTGMALSSSIGFVPAYAAGMATMAVATKVLFPSMKSGVKGVREFTGNVKKGKTISLSERISLKYDDHSSGVWNFYNNNASTTVGNISIKLSNNTVIPLRFNLNEKLPIDSVNITKLIETLGTAVNQGVIPPQEALNIIEELEGKKEFERDSKNTFEGELLPERYTRKFKESLTQLILNKTHG